jgi:signal transduction histidine kinase
MRPKTLVLFLLIILAPLAVLAWLGARVSRGEREMVRRQFTEVLTAKLQDLDLRIGGLLAERERQFLRLTDIQAAFDPETLREIVRTNPLISQIFVIGPGGELIHPPPHGALTGEEREFLKRARHFLADRQVLIPTGGTESAVGKAPAPEKGWYAWQWENGLNLVFWRRLSGGRVAGVELERTRLLADVISRLPQADEASSGNYAIQLVDANGGLAYQWGGREPETSEKPRVVLALSPPLSSWRLQYYAGPELETALRSGALATLTGGLLVALAAFLILAFYFFREYSRDLREAAVRVSFVNQVSHELKTPLTNIRMYAELLEERLPAAEEDAAPARRYLDVIVSESQRLSRLIANVLTFARQQKKTLALHYQPGSVDETIAAAVSQFRPALEAKGVAIHACLKASRLVRFDPDALQQILGNLFNNVEKYAAGGGWLEILSNQEDGRTCISVSDHGPGIPAIQREKVFEPFYRLNDKVSEGVAGAGIGLTIARELARLHGGDLELEATEPGAIFRLTLATPPDLHCGGRA